MSNGGRRAARYLPARVAEDARAAERADIARELHDTVIQPLAALVTSLESLSQRPVPAGVMEAHISAWGELAHEAIVALRAALIGMRAQACAELGLPEAVNRYLVPQARSQGIRLTLESRDWAAGLPIDWTSSLYLIVREALTNVQKHARATEVTILLRADDRCLHLIITDNGVGFDPMDTEDRATRPGRSSFGLLGMRERVGMLGGTLAVASEPGNGTRVELLVPRPRTASAAGEGMRTCSLPARASADAPEAADRVPAAESHAERVTSGVLVP